ncbi:MAG: NosD domain-containing protein [Candidatus Thermoplasmatota archaeon]
MKTKWLAVGIILLFVGVTIAPAIAQTTEKQSVSRGTWLYVGGSGPGNYTRIQDAIDNAGDGDTVFVYNESSPYYENILISTSLTLRGEQKTSTIIKGMVSIATHGVTVTGFTIEDSYGVDIPGLIGTGTEESPNIIDGNIMRNVSVGVTVRGAGKTCGYFIISNNVIYAHQVGIQVFGKNNTVFGNIISFTNYPASYYGITSCGDFNNISYNTISGAGAAIYILRSLKTMIYHNNIIENPGYGVLLVESSGGDMILQNNFMKNGKNAYISFKLTVALNTKYYNAWGQEHPIILSVWDGNYWDEPRLEPYPIDGFFCIHGILFTLLWILLGINYYNFKNFQRFDMHPAQEPYDIPGMS